MIKDGYLALRATLHISSRDTKLYSIVDITGQEEGGGIELQGSELLPKGT